jgi:hypothetical protein
MRCAVVHDQEYQTGLFVFLASDGSFRKKCVSESVREEIAVNVCLLLIINFDFLLRVTEKQHIIVTHIPSDDQSWTQNTSVNRNTCDKGNSFSFP